jgi:phospholipid-binding lipoprotein MlaA
MQTSGLEASQGVHLMPRGVFDVFRTVCILVLIISVSGCATTGSADPRDPWEGFNRGVFSFNETMDDAIFTPIGNLYQTITPEFVDRGVTNFFNNLNDIAVVVNDILQFKIDQALSDASRFIFNSTIGLAGFFDVSTPMGLPKHDEDFGQTLAYWGVGSGPFLMVPFFGPATIRDTLGLAVDNGVLNPIFYLDNTELKAGLLTLNYVDFKADLISAKKLVEEAAIDEYEFVKNAYFEKRANQISDGAVQEYSEP